MKNFLLFVLVLGLVGYIAYDKLYSTEEAKEPVEAGVTEDPVVNGSQPETEPAATSVRSVDPGPATAPDPMKRAFANLSMPAENEGERRPAPRTAEEISEILVQGQKAEEAGDIVGAWTSYTDAYLAGVPEKYAARLQAKLAGLSREQIDRRAALPGLLDVYEVQPADSLWEIANRWERDTGVPVASGFIRHLNALSSDSIREGQNLLMPVLPARVLCIKSRHRLYLLLGDCYLAEWGVGLGQSGHETPDGEFLIASRLENPEFYDRERGRKLPFGHPDNPLGTRWLGFADPHSSYGIHGTWEDDSIGGNRSKGCLRMRNEEVEALFELIPLKTQVTIQP